MNAKIKKLTLFKPRRYVSKFYITNLNDSHFLTSPVLFKRHGILSRTRQLAIPSFAFTSFRGFAF